MGFKSAVRCFVYYSGGGLKNPRAVACIIARGGETPSLPLAFKMAILFELPIELIFEPSVEDLDP
ncbi:MAG: hypothetical protein MUO62_16000 [Anaerolineales bacterium]|nr:hypothetical protein [Anaerolineales bacterium]